MEKKKSMETSGLKEINELEPHVREKAIEFLNELKTQGLSDDAAIKEAIKRAQKWFLDIEG